MAPLNFAATSGEMDFREQLQVICVDLKLKDATPRERGGTLIICLTDYRVLTKFVSGSINPLLPSDLQWSWLR